MFAEDKVYFGFKFPAWSLNFVRAGCTGEVPGLKKAHQVVAVDFLISVPAASSRPAIYPGFPIPSGNRCRAWSQRC